MTFSAQNVAKCKYTDIKLNDSTVNNQLAEININTNQIIKIAVVAIAIALSAISIWWFNPVKSDPYVETVLSFEGNIERGEAIFQVNCAGCHGIEATGNVGPSLLDVAKRKSQTQIIHQVVGGKTPPMPQFQPSEEDMADLLSYLHKIS